MKKKKECEGERRFKKWKELKMFDNWEKVCKKEYNKRHYIKNDTYLFCIPLVFQLCASSRALRAGLPREVM